MFVHPAARLSTALYNVPICLASRVTSCVDAAFQNSTAFFPCAVGTGSCVEFCACCPSLGCLFTSRMKQVQHAHTIKPWFYSLFQREVPEGSLCRKRRHHARPAQLRQVRGHVSGVVTFHPCASWRAGFPPIREKSDNFFQSGKSGEQTSFPTNISLTIL